MMLRALAILTALLVSIAVLAPPAQATTPARIDLLVISDSTGRGWNGTGYSPWGGWRGRVLNALWKTHDVRPFGRTTQAESAAYGGFEAIGPNGTAANATAALDDVFAALSRPPDIVIIGLGINDGLGVSWAVPAPSYSIAAPITALVIGIASRAPAAEIYVCAIPVLNWGADSTNWSSLYNAYLPVALEDARLAGAQATFIDCTAGMWSIDAPTSFPNLSDAVHPNESGYVLMAANIEAALRKHSALLKAA